MPFFPSIKGKRAEGHKRSIQEAKEAKEKAKDLPKEFDYYCPRCLYQTNAAYIFCPSCGTNKMARTKEKKAAKKIEEDEEEEESFEFYCPACFHQSNEGEVKCPKCRESKMKRVKTGD